MDLLREGEAPTAAQVADRAGVGIRTVFRHYADMESLYEAMRQRVGQLALPRIVEPSSRGDLRERGRELARVRADLYEFLAPYKRAGNARREGSAFLTASHRDFVRQMRAHLLRWLPELGGADRELFAAVEQVTSFDAWNNLRVDQNLSRARALATTQRCVDSLLAQVAGSARAN